MSKLPRALNQNESPAEGPVGPRGGRVPSRPLPGEAGCHRAPAPNSVAVRSICWPSHTLSVSARRAGHSGSRRGLQSHPRETRGHLQMDPAASSAAVTLRWSLPGESGLSRVPRPSLFGCRAAGAPQRAAGAPGRSDRPQPPAPVGAGQRRGLPDPVLHRAGARAAQGTVADLLLVRQPRGHGLHRRKVPSVPGDPIQEPGPCRQGPPALSRLPPTGSESDTHL